MYSIQLYSCCSEVLLSVLYLAVQLTFVLLWSAQQQTADRQKIRDYLVNIGQRLAAEVQHSSLRSW